MERRTVDLRIGGQSYRVVSSASEDELRRLASTVEGKILEMSPPGKPVPPQALVLAALALAHDLEAERARREALERRSRDMMRRVLVRVESALDTDEAEAASPIQS
jgi:cell division protein ZapA